MASAVKDSLATTKLPELSLPQRNAGSPPLFFCGNENDAQTNELDVAGSGIILRLEATVAAFTATEPVSGTPREAEQAMALRFFAKCSTFDSDRMIMEMLVADEIAPGAPGSAFCLRASRRRGKMDRSPPDPA